MTGLLTSMGHRVHTLRDGKSALAAARSFRPHVVLLDIGLPDITGYEVARAMRADPELARLKIIAMTGFGRDQDKRAAHAAGIDHHLTKPIDEEQLMRLLRTGLQ
jgi:CheY-like chemotaxis protein